MRKPITCGLCGRVNYRSWWQRIYLGRYCAGAERAECDRIVLTKASIEEYKRRLPDA